MGAGDGCFEPQMNMGQHKMVFAADYKGIDKKGPDFDNKVMEEEGNWEPFRFEDQNNWEEFRLLEDQGKELVHHKDSYNLVEVPFLL
jgi:hypothetical protein